jgi:hypothetical protein
MLLVYRCRRYQESVLAGRNWLIPDIYGAFSGTNQLIKFELYRPGVAALGVLNVEYHQQGDDRIAGVNDKLRPTYTRLGAYISGYRHI